MDDCAPTDKMLTNKEEEYKVIDECTEEEMPEEIEQNPQTEVISALQTDDEQQQQEPDAAIQNDMIQSDEIQNDTIQNDAIQNDEIQNDEIQSDTIQSDNAKSQDDNIINVDKPVPMEVENANVDDDATDFTADISLDQLDMQKEVTDEDVMHHLDVIENIELDPETFGIDRSMEVTQSCSRDQEEEKQDDDITIISNEIIEDPVEAKWYEQKIAEKDSLLRERLSKLARVLAVSYPHYEKWLERQEKVEGTPICKIDPIRRCSLKNPHTNRWKFMCSKKQIQCIKEEDNPNSKTDWKTVWSLEPTGAGGIDTDNPAEFPSFVINAVKIFEDFLQTTLLPPQGAVLSNESTNVEIKKETGQNKRQLWLSLLVRCNSMNELMLFATGKDITRATMDRLKQTYESGPGKNCNVKSLYCKSINKCDDKVVTTFLVGAEALDEVVGNLKVQLAPKTNFWSNAAGAWNVARTVADVLRPTAKTTVLEIGCGIGLIGLTIASKCREVIGVDSPSEIEEAEMTCELNSIYNMSFIKGTTPEIVTKINSARDLHNKSRMTYSIINTNTNMGRAIEVMTCLRKITSLRRIVMVTTLTKQSVRAILELARPIENGLGHPFMPIRACVVDTLPNGPHFEAVILMERRLMHRLTQPWFLKMLEQESKSIDSTREIPTLEVPTTVSDIDKGAEMRKNPLAKKAKAPPLAKKPVVAAKSGAATTAKGKAKLKRDHSPEISEMAKKVSKKFEKTGTKPRQQDVTAKKKNWLHASSSLRINPLFEKKTRDNKEQADLREKLSGNRIDADLIQRVNESREILEAAKEKLSGPSPTMDATTAKEIKNVLSLVLDQTSKLQNQLPRSVWDRIAPPETDPNKVQVKKELDDDPLLKGRFVQETRAQDILITTANKEYLEIDEVKPKFKKYHNLAPLEPNTVMPVSLKFKKGDNKGPQKSNNRNRQQNQGPWNKNKNFDKNRGWNNASKKFNSPTKKQDLYRPESPPSRFSPKRPLLSPPRHPCSPPRRHFSPNGPYETRRVSPSRCEYSPQRREMSPLRQMTSPSGGRHQIGSPPRRPFSPHNQRPMSPLMTRRHMSPPRQLMSSPPRRQMSPMRMYETSTREMSPMRRPMSPVGYRTSPERRPISPSRSRDIIPPAHQSSMRHYSPPRRQQSPPRRQSPPQNRFDDEWDIPSRGAIEQSSTWQRSINERSENIWRNEKQSTITSGGGGGGGSGGGGGGGGGGNNWQISSDNERYRKSANQDNTWDIRDSTSQGNTWGAKQSLSKPIMKESWQAPDNRWSSGPNIRSNTGGENWNRGGRENLGGGRKEPWMNADKPRWEQPNTDSWNQGDKDDWNDLPEDARDPWGDDGGNLGMSNERWMNCDNQIVASSSSGWSRDADKGDPWAKPKENNWQNKSQAFSTKPMCPNSGNLNMNESRWLSGNDMSKKIQQLSSTNWQGGANAGPWQTPNYSFQSQSQRPFVNNPFKDRR